MSEVNPPLGPPARFPGCPSCAYLSGGPPALCLDCASATFTTIDRDACPVCSQRTVLGRCGNELCRDPRRRISRIRAIAYHDGDLRSKIITYKYKDKPGWGTIFGRLLLGWLERNAHSERPDLIVANPSYRGPTGQGFGHTEQVITAADREDVLGVWPFDVHDPRALVKTRRTTRSAHTPLTSKVEAAKEHRAAIVVPDRARIEGRHILLYDDVCTSAHQLDEVAGLLVDECGATSVEAVVLTRAPWVNRT